MATEKDYLGDKLRLVERARENTYFRKLDQELIDKMRQQAAPQEAQEDNAESRLDNAFSSILVPVDFSPCSRQALEKAADLAERFEASIIVLHVIDSEMGAQALARRLGISTGELTATGESGETEGLSDDAIKTVLDPQREQAYQALQTFLPSDLADYPLELRVVFGRPFERIVETAVAEEMGVIVMGTHGRTGLAHLALGSIAERVVRLAPCSVLTVKSPAAESDSWLQDFYTRFLGARSG